MNVLWSAVLQHGILGVGAVLSQGKAGEPLHLDWVIARP